MPLIEQNNLATGEMSVRHVFIRDLMIDCIIGVHDSEHHATQRLRINLDMYIPEEKTSVHELRDVVCYDDVIRKITRLVTEKRFRLLETVGDKIAELCLNDVRIARIRVMLEKLDVYKNASSVGIEIWRARAVTPPAPHSVREHGSLLTA
ncbi:hypothetical protein ASC80_12410 [Afipia sp. Root123D2]|uniref:dihydroneopterin aldolase n=1 Tax=Afipia sp. Root123D2 TaxID=1736436 RepID=UPI0006FE7329|nr:dihydroneopterin aldolase [Afipia sp. Root123D2]KQW20959.1 hypothetical protein ASC80_12410 [Afipia sp. Root123D2]